MTKKIFSMVIFGLAFMVAATYGMPDTADVQVSIIPNQIMIGAAYNGQKLEVTGSLPAASTAIIRVTGHTEHSKLKIKGRALGVLWMNQGAVEISNVPNVFLLFLPEGVRSATQMDPSSPVMPELGIESIRKQADIVSAGGDRNELFDEFVKLKQKTGLYGTVPDAIGTALESSTLKSFHCTVSMPAALPQGTYKLEVFGIQNNAVVSYAAREIEAREVGMPAFISSLAFKHGTLYGVLAVLIAVIAGLGTGIMFKGGKGAH